MWMRVALVVSIVLAAGLARADAPVPPREHPVLRDIAAAVDPAGLQATLTTLVGFGTRHTLSDTQSSSRGIGAARNWVQSRFTAISKGCGGCLEVLTPAQVFNGDRLPKEGASVMDVVAVQKGSVDPGRYVIMTAHLDSRVSDPMNATADAPGADDDGSGVAAVLEAARVLSKYKFDATIVYGVLSGEEQGLYGGKLLAQYAKDHGWRVEGDLNNDIVGNIEGQNGIIDDTAVRVFSEGTRALETADDANYRRYHGGEVDSPSRNLARYMATLGEQYVPNWHVTLVYRTDRYGRGGDHVAFNQLGFPALRVTEANENYTRQHQDVQTEDGIAYGDVLASVSFPYLAKVTAMNAVTLAALAWAPPPPVGVDLAGAVTPDTVLKWQRIEGSAARDLAGYRVCWRSTTEPGWSRGIFVGDAADYTLKGVSIDDYFFGVASVSKDGFESPVVFPGVTGAF
jgi:Zn-dependent M28 family amino/carboxypeptidase